MVSRGETPQGGVEMEPVELFRLRFLRDAEERFRVGVLNMSQGFHPRLLLHLFRRMAVGMSVR